MSECSAPTASARVALLAPLTSPALKVLLNTTQINQRLSVVMKTVIYKLPVGNFTKYLVGHHKWVMLKTRIFFIRDSILCKSFSHSKLMRLGVPYRFVIVKLKSQSELDCQFWSDSDSNDVLESTIAIKIDLFDIISIK